MADIEELAVFVPMGGRVFTEAEILTEVHREMSRTAPGGYSLRHGYTERQALGMTGRQYIADVARRVGLRG